MERCTSHLLSQLPADHASSLTFTHSKLQGSFQQRDFDGVVGYGGAFVSVDGGDSRSNLVTLPTAAPTASEKHTKWAGAEQQFWKLSVDEFDIRTIIATAGLSLLWLASYLAYCHGGGVQLTMSQNIALLLLLTFQAAYPLAIKASKACSRFQVEYATTLRLLQPAVGLVLGRHSPQHSVLSTLLNIIQDGDAISQSPQLSVWAFLLDSLLSSNAVLLALAAFSSRLSFRRHCLLHAVAVAVLVARNLGACTMVCSSQLSPLTSFFSFAVHQLSALTMPALATAGLAAVGGDLLPGPSTPRFQCWLVWTFLTVTLGGVAPTAVLMWQERSRRRCRHQHTALAARVQGGKLPGCSSPKPREMCGCPDLLDVAISNGVFLVVTVLALIWVLCLLGAVLMEQLQGKVG